MNYLRRLGLSSFGTRTAWSVLLLVGCSAPSHEAGPSDGGHEADAKVVPAALDAGCHWSLKPRSGLGVSRSYLVCGGNEAGAIEACPSDDGLTCAKPLPQVEPCLAACAPTQYAVEIALNFATGDYVDAGPLPASCGSTLPSQAVQAGLSSGDDGPFVQCCACEPGP